MQEQVKSDNHDQLNIPSLAGNIAIAIICTHKNSLARFRASETFCITLKRSIDSLILTQDDQHE